MIHQEIKTVYLYTGGVKKAHAIYREMSRFSPYGFQYLPSEKDFFTPRPNEIHSKLGNWIGKKEPKILQILRMFRVPKARYIRIPRGVKLIHSGQYPLLNHTPWVMDFENAITMAWYDRATLDTWWVKRFFEGLFASSSCRALLPWTTAAKESLLHAFDTRGFQEKIHVIHHIIVPQEYPMRDFHREPKKLLFCSGNFYFKGGLGAILASLEVMKLLDVELTVVSDMPQEIMKRFGDHPRMKFLRFLGAPERHELMRTSDLLLHPAHSETYGYVMLEAFSFGLPVVSTTGFSAPELVEDGVRGRVVENFLSWFDKNSLPWVRSKAQYDEFLERLKNPPQDYIVRLSQAIHELLQENNLRKFMSENAYRSVTEGIFSPEKRKESMQKLYEQCPS